MLAFLRRLIRDRSGNVALMFAAALGPLVFLTGMAIDYTMAADRQAQLNGFADAAALAAVTPTMMSQSNATATTAAQNAFNSQVSALQTTTNLTYSSTNLTVNVTTSTGGTRTAVVSYAAAAPTFFSSILKVNQINISGSSTATGGLPPNINFYMLLDSSPSMAIAATTAGMNTLITNTQNQSDGSSAKGCAFACHENAPSKENPALNNPKIKGSSTCNGKEDNYALARCLSLTLRIDLVSQATQSLMTTAVAKMTDTKSTYQMAIYTFDVAVNTIQKLTTDLTSQLSAAQTAAQNKIQVLAVCYNNVLYDNNTTGCSGPSTGIGNGDMDTDFDQAMFTMNKTMPNPGSGTNASGDTPQEFLFLVTDGVEDACESISTQNSYSGGGCRQQWYMNYANASGNTYAAPGATDWCTTIKNRGIRIAVLYTTYVPMISPPMANGYNSSWYSSFGGAGKGISAFINATTDTVASTKSLQGCASPGLFYEVQNDGDITTALNTLFLAAVQSAYLSK